MSQSIFTEQESWECTERCKLCFTTPLGFICYIGDIRLSRGTDSVLSVQCGMFPFNCGPLRTWEPETLTLHRACVLMEAASPSWSPHCPQSWGCSVCSKSTQSYLIVSNLHKLTKRRGRQQTNALLPEESQQSARQGRPGRWGLEGKWRKMPSSPTGRPCVPSQTLQSSRSSLLKARVSHCPTQVMENWAESLTPIWSMFPRNTQFQHRAERIRVWIQNH